MPSSHWKFFALLFPFLGISVAYGRDEVRAKAGEEVFLPCAINRGECGDFHSIKWYKENRRVFVYSPMADFAKAEGELLERAQLMIDDSSQEAKLKLESIKTSDEGEYKCEITFLDITKNCPVVQLVKLVTLAEPKYLNISLPDGQDVLESSSVGPFNEGQEIRLLCESGGGKPIPKVTWYNGSEIISGKASSFEEQDGTGTGRNEIRIKLGRGDLGSQFSCQAENEAIEGEPLKTSVQVDVNLRPHETEIVSPPGAVETGAVVTLLCRSRGARPPAVITWYNGSTPMVNDAAPTETTAIQDDQTYETQSRISFVASRFENGEFITCEANNSVLEARQEEPQRSSITLQVLYAPVVEISPENVTANETERVTIHCTHDSNPALLKSVKWYLNGQLVDTSNETRYDDATPENPSLVINSASADDIGDYTCVLENEIGAGESENVSSLSVQYKPTVVLRMDPSSPVSELDRTNVTLFCDVLEGNPDYLQTVKWFMDGVLLKQLPLCEEEDEELCDIDPSKLLLEHVTKTFRGNYSCQGANEAGWSELSDEKTLEVFYPPGPSFITQDSIGERVVKGDSITLTCDVSDLGRPQANEFVWLRGGHVVNHVKSLNWTIDPVTLEAEANISCVAVNAVGEGAPDFISIDVAAPPSFIVRLPPYTGAMAEAENFSVSCQVECSPLCGVVWLKDGVQIDEDDDRFTIDNVEKEPNYAKNDFESIHSTLSWNVGNWPGGKLDRVIDNANFTCQSTGNAAGDGVASTTYFRVEYPPENMLLSDTVITIEEGSPSDKILCTAEAYPPANYVWMHQEQVVASDNVLYFDRGIKRQQGGEYSCVATNRHGQAESRTIIDVLYKPICDIQQSEEDGLVVLTCESSANPSEVSFEWRRHGGNDTISEGVIVDGLISTLKLEAADNFGTYVCHVNNSLGKGSPCEIDVQGLGVIKMGSANIIIIVAVIAAAIVALLILIVIVILICRRRKPGEKYTNHQDMEEREKNAEGTAAAAANNNQDDAAGGGHANSNPPVQHKWPVRPGVHVHVNGMHTLNNNKATSSAASSPTEAYSRPPSGASPVSDSASSSDSSSATATTTATVCGEIRRPPVTNRGTSTSQRQGDSVIDREQSKAAPPRPLAKLSAENLASTFSKLRRKPVSENPSNNGGNKSSPDSGFPADDPNSLNGDPGKAVYENLPFHGLQQNASPRQQDDNPITATALETMMHPLTDSSFPPPPPSLSYASPPDPPATVTTVTTTTSGGSSRPSSQLSQNGSSGYGSTRSQGEKGANWSPAIEPLRNNQQQPPLRRNDLPTPMQLARQHYPMFASLRIPNRVRPAQVPEEREDDPGLDLVDAELDSTGEPEENNNNDPSLPTPAPRQQQQQPPKPSYMNMPYPLRPAHSVETMQILTAVPYNYHQSLPRHFLREDAAVMNLQQHQTLVSNLIPNNHHHHLGVNPATAATELPTVSATLYDFPGRNTQFHGGGGGGMILSNSRYHTQQQQQRTPSYTFNTVGRALGPTREQQQQRQFDSYYYHPATLLRSCDTSQSSSSSTSTATRPLLPSHNSNRVVYADLSLEGGPGGQRRDQRTTEYAVLKFNANNQVGKEIDV